MVAGHPGITPGRNPGDINIRHRAQEGDLILCGKSRGDYVRSNLR